MPYSSAQALFQKRTAPMRSSAHTATSGVRSTAVATCATSSAAACSAPTLPSASFTTRPPGTPTLADKDLLLRAVVPKA